MATTSVLEAYNQSFKEALYKFRRSCLATIGVYNSVLLPLPDQSHPLKRGVEDLSPSELITWCSWSASIKK